MPAEILNRQNLRDTLAGLTAWQTWTGLADLMARKARIQWPEVNYNQLPAICLSLGASARANISSVADSSSNFRTSGSILVEIFADHDNADDWQTGEDDFGTQVFGLLEEFVAALDDQTLIVHRIQIPENSLKPGAVNTFHAQDADADGNDDATEKVVWSASFSVHWGLG